MQSYRHDPAGSGGSWVQHPVLHAQKGGSQMQERSQSLGCFNCYADSLLLRRDGTIRADDLASFILGIMENGHKLDAVLSYATS